MPRAEISHSYLFDSYVANVQGHMVRDEHRHAAMQLTVSLDGQPHGVGASVKQLRPALIHLVGSNVPHAFDGADGVQVLFWLAPESAISRRLASTYLQNADMTALPDDLAAALPLAEIGSVRHRHAAQAPGAQMRRHTETLLSTLSPWTIRPPHALHPAVRKAVRVIRALETKQISADELAARVGLSKGRLLHVFKDDMGIALRPYLQWLRCIEVLALLAEGHSVTDAALLAGFTDGAHCNRVVKRYVCLSPSVLAGRDLHVQRCLGEAPADPDPSRGSTFVPAKPC